MSATTINYVEYGQSTTQTSLGEPPASPAKPPAPLLKRALTHNLSLVALAALAILLIHSSPLPTSLPLSSPNLSWPSVLLLTSAHKTDRRCDHDFPKHLPDCGQCWLCPLCSLPPPALAPQCDDGLRRLREEGTPPGALSRHQPHACCALCSLFCDEHNPDATSWAHAHGLSGGRADASRSVCETMQAVCPVDGSKG